VCISGYVTSLKIGSEARWRAHRAAAMHGKVANEVKKHFRYTDIRISNTGGAKKWQCTFCELQITGSATKLKAHLLGVNGQGIIACVAVSVDAKMAIVALEEEFPAGGKQAYSLVQSSSGSSRQPLIPEVFARLSKDEVDSAIALWIYVNGIPFNVVRYV